jgi:inorganic pyrophosphatase
MTAKFWAELETLLAESRIVIDRPKGRPHPRYPDVIYPLDYGYLEGTSAGDGDGIDVWIGSKAEKTLTGILCTFDTVKRDAEIKLLAGCSAQDVETVLCFFNEGFMRYLYIPKQKE